MDYYLNYEHCLSRLQEELNKHKQLIIAYDYDDTVHDFHNKNRTYDDVISLLQTYKELGIGKFICFTASKKNRYKEIQDYLIKNNIPCDKINEGFEGCPNGGKIYYNILLDDRAGLFTSYKLLKDLLKDIE